MLADREGAAVAMLRKLGVAPEGLAGEALRAVERLPKIGGAGAGEAYISPRTKAVLEAAFAEATQMKDEYVSVEHILLAIIEEKGGEAGRILSRRASRAKPFSRLCRTSAEASASPIPIPRKNTRPCSASAAT